MTGPEELAEDVFLDFLDRTGGGAEGFDELCAERPELADELRRLHADWNWLERQREGDDGPVESPLRQAADRYALRDKVAEGGMGEIFRVWDLELRRELAMKVCRVGQPGGSAPTSTRRGFYRFLDEAQVTAQLDHPGVVPIHELGVDAEGHVFFTMKLVKGETLRRVFELARAGQDGWNVTRAVGVLGRVCDTMAFAHDKGVVHRDLKPANVMVGRFGETYVMDWGLARLVGEDEATDEEPISGVRTLRAEVLDAEPESSLRTEHGSVLGTPAYMAPEQARGDPDEVGPAADVYAVGAMLYHLLAGERPYGDHAGPSTSASAVLDAVVAGPPTALERLAPDQPEELVSICRKAMARESGERYASMEHLAEDLRAYLEGRVVRAYETGAWAEARKWVGRNRALAGALAAGLVLLVAGLVTSLALKGQSDENAREARAERNNVLRLSAFQKLDELRTRADDLWPVDAVSEEDYDAWLTDARELIAGLEPRGEDAGHLAQLAELRERAVPRTEEELEHDRESHPSYPELRRRLAAIEYLRRVRAIRAGEAEPEIPELGPRTRSMPVRSLIRASLERVRPDRGEFGREAEGLALARLAMERLGPEHPVIDHASGGQALAWGLFSNGLDEEAEAAWAALIESMDPMRQERYGAQADYMQEMLAEIADGKDVEEIENLEVEIAELEAVVDERRTYSFASDEEQWWHGQLGELVAELEAFADPETGLVEGLEPGRGWGVAWRRDEGHRVTEASVGSEAARAAWAEAIESIAVSAEYGGLEITPQRGLVPIGRDPVSGFWEFGHPLTGEPPTRDDEGRLRLDGGSSLVFVLVPAGSFAMGAQRDDPQAPGFDPIARFEEGPVHEVELSAYFLSKYEMTQHQWKRFWGDNPSQHPVGRQLLGVTAGPLQPVENVSWVGADRTVRRMGLALPSEAQWEYAARAGTTEPWWTGSDPEALVDAANLADRSIGTKMPWTQVPWDDGSQTMAEVGSFRANPFGFHDVHGNAWEWCADGYITEYYSESPRKDPLARSDKPERAVRGGCFALDHSHARSACRRSASQTVADGFLGIRPARPVVGATP